MEKLSRRTFLTATAATTIWMGSRSWATAQTPLNVLIIKSDEHNPFFGSFDPTSPKRAGYPQVDTPNLSQLAENGVVFRNTYCPSPLCMPSRSAFCSGRRVHQIQTYSNCNVFKQDLPSYGRLLAQAGVHSVHIGKTDFYNEGVKLGFSEIISPGDRKNPDAHISRHPLTIRADGATRASGFGVKPEPFEHDLKRTEETVRWLHETAPQLGQPWTCEVNLVKPHFPHFVTQELWDRYAANEDLPAYGGDVDSAKHPFAMDLRAHFQTDAFTEAQIRGLRRGYYGCISFIDEQVGRILKALDESGQRSRTIVAYTSDHGEMLGKFGMWWKCSLYEDSVRVPLIMSGPGLTPGTVVETPVDHHDLQATLFQGTGKESARPEDWAGQPLQNIPANDPNRVVFSEYHGHGTHASGFLIRKGDWKLLYNCEAPHQLFNLKEDPDELNNLASTKPEKFAELKADLLAICDPEAENQRAEEYILKQIEEMKRVGVG